jgi:hypothetical protein
MQRRSSGLWLLLVVWDSYQRTPFNNSHICNNLHLDSVTN